jgi:mannose-6-phosphate isomerase-like protein (cupin superfamily)
LSLSSGAHSCGRRRAAVTEINYEEETVVTEARLERLASGLAPVTPGWFVVNTADAAWTNNDAYGGVCIFESDRVVLQGRPDLTEYVKPDAGFTIRVVPPGKPMALYHAESVQEDFLVLLGECTLIIEDQERHLRAWDFVHCPPMTSHTFVATEAGPCVILATGNRRDDLERVYRGSEAALRHDAGPASTRPSPSAERNGRFARPRRWNELPWQRPYSEVRCGFDRMRAASTNRAHD